MALQKTDLTRLMDNARVYLPGALDGAIKLEIFNVFNDFLQRTLLWKEDVSFPVLSTNLRGDEVDISIEAGAIDQLVYVLDDNKNPRNMGMVEPGTLTFIDIPGSDGTWTATVSVTVTDPLDTNDYPQLPGWILNKYSNGLLDGVVGRMMAQIAKPYSSDKMAIFRLKSYDAVCAQGKVDAARGNMYAGQTWRFPQNFASGNARRGGGW